MPNLIKLSIILIIFGFLISGEVILAQEATPDQEVTQMISQDEDIQPEDLGISEPKLLPDSPFYFLKDWARKIQSTFTFNKVKKAELENKFANEKLIELKKLVEKNATLETIEKATENYKKATEKVKEKVDKIQEKAAENEKVDNFLDKFTKQQILHEKVLQKLENQVPQEVFAKIKEAREKHLEKFGEVMTKLEDRSEKIKEKIENTLNQQEGSQFKNFKNLEILKNIEEKVPEKAKEAIQQVQENSLKKLKGDLEKMSADDQEKFSEYVEKISGVKETHLEILENLKSEIKAGEQRGIDTEKVKMIRDLEEKIEEGKTKIFEKIEKKLEKLDCPVWTSPAPEFCKEGRVIIEKDEKGCPLSPKCIMPGEQLAGLVTCCMDSACVRVTKEKCDGAGGKIVGAGSCIPNPCEKKEISEKPTIPEKPEVGACVTLWDPVCSKDGKTYSNSCFAKSAGMEIDYEGVCKEQEQRGVDVEKVK